jgi:hypothetical protein
VLQVELLIQQSGAIPYRVSQEMASAMSALIAKNPTGDPGTQTLALGQGSWEVSIMYAADMLQYSCIKYQSLTSTLVSPS